MDAESPEILLFGATGSIGRSTADLLREAARGYRLSGISAHRRGEGLAALAREFDVPSLHLGDPQAAESFRADHPDLASRLSSPGEAGEIELLERHPQAMVINGIVGAAGLRPTQAALERGMDVALANKEALVVGGELVLAAAERSGARIWPVDSEHSAIAQCLRGNGREEVRRLWLTASGGPFRDRPPSELARVPLEEVLAHPTWKMGPKISVDSATMMNKGLEVIEAHYLFNTPYTGIEVVIHRESIVHSMVEFVDGAFLAQMGAPDMRVPILFALSRGRHRPCSLAPWSPLEASTLHFEAPSEERYPCLGLARAAGARGGAAPIVLNAANEEAVAGLLREDVHFGDLPGIIEQALEKTPLDAVSSVEEALERDAQTRRGCRELVRSIARSPA
jgi:1-deoxy-D-xylulose-5-phosphate reductoisomerase